MRQNTIDHVRQLSSREGGLAVVVTQREDGRPRASVVNATVVGHPLTAEPVIAFVSKGSARKLDDLRCQPAATVVFRCGWEWLAVEGFAQLAGPDDRVDGLGDEALLSLLRTVYATSVGGSPDEWAELDDAMMEERHTAVLVQPLRIYPEIGGTT